MATDRLLFDDGNEGDDVDPIADTSFMSRAPEAILECAETTAALLGSGVEISTAASHDEDEMAAIGAFQGAAAGWC